MIPDPSTPHLRQDTERLWDLCRLQRAELHEQGAITNEEYAALAADFSARKRIESYDELQAALTSTQQARDAAEAKVQQLTSALSWALGEEGDFGEEPPPLAGKYRQRYWWRTELRRRAFGEAPEQTDNALEASSEREDQPMSGIDRAALVALVGEMRTVALVSGQYGVECRDFDAEAHVAYADRLTEWANKLAALLEASSEAPQAGPVVNGGGNHYDNPATWAKEASPTVDREASSSVTPSVPAFEVCPFCRNLGFVADNIVYKNCERHRDVDTGSAPQIAKESR